VATLLKNNINSILTRLLTPMKIYLEILHEFYRAALILDDGILVNELT
jgi:hypothetical protein